MRSRPSTVKDSLREVSSALGAQYQKGKLLRELFITLKDTFW
jgi:hypothetical protein